jgi:hypothetical protein
MSVAASTATKRTTSAAELTQQQGVPKKPRTGDPLLGRHQATLSSEAVDVNPVTLQPELSTTSQAQMLQTPTKPLKGRRRFVADLEELRSTGFTLHNHRVNSTWNCVWPLGRTDLYVSTGLRSGDDEGSVEFAILKANQHLVTVNLLASGKQDPTHSKIVPIYNRRFGSRYLGLPRESPILCLCS